MSTDRSPNVDRKPNRIAEAFRNISRAAGDCALAVQGYSSAVAEHDPQARRELDRHSRVLIPRKTIRRLPPPKG